MFGFIIILLIVGAIIIGVGVVITKAQNKVTNKVMRATGLGNALNSQVDQMNAKAIAKLDVLLKEGKITQAQYDQRIKNLNIGHDFNEE